MRAPKSSPEALARKVIDLCADCDQCRDFMEDTPCLFFRELYRLYDKEKEGGSQLTSGELRSLIDLCNMCGLCSCPNVRANIRQAKDGFIARDGLAPALRILEDVQLVGRLCGAYPRLANLLIENRHTGRLIKALAGIHPERKLPTFPPEGFTSWARAKGLDRHSAETRKRKVAYFAGCTARYLFPDVAKATVAILERNGIEVHVPEQKCCGMPTLLEGDRSFTFAVARRNLATLNELVEDGYDVVCSCPTCGYLLKNMFAEGAYMSEEYRALVMAGKGGSSGEGAGAGGEERQGARRAASGASRNRAPLAGLAGKLHVAGYLRDESYFAFLGGLERINVSSHTYDLGEYLRDLDRSGKLNRSLGPVAGRLVYFAPCHLKEQNIGQPWWDLLGLVPGISVERVGGVFDCCGMSGIMGLKREFHEVSLAMGSCLVKKINAAGPDRVLSDCLSCRIQFDQTLPHEVRHPVEILAESYAAFRS